MSHPLPQLLPHCSHQHFCEMCRKLSSGREFRSGALRRSELDCEPDFTCPKGKPWISEGLGDTIAKVTDALHIPKCGGCKKRQAKLNKLVPYKKSP